MKCKAMTMKPRHQGLHRNVTLTFFKWTMICQAWNTFIKKHRNWIVKTPTNKSSATRDVLDRPAAYSKRWCIWGFSCAKQTQYTDSETHQQTDCSVAADDFRYQTQNEGFHNSDSYLCTTLILALFCFHFQDPQRLNIVINSWIDDLPYLTRSLRFSTGTSWCLGCVAARSCVLTSSWSSVAHT